MDTETAITTGSPPRISWLRRHKAVTGLSALATAAIAVTAVAIALTHQGQLAVHGNMEVLESCVSASTDYPDITSGAQVVVTDASGKVLAVTALRSSKDISSLACDFPFTVTVPSGQSRYGIVIGHNRGTVWFTSAEMKHGPGLDLTPSPAF